VPEVTGAGDPPAAAGWPAWFAPDQFRSDLRESPL